MQAIGLFEAKTHLSAYVARAEAGEEVVIMRHHKPVARIVPIAAPSPATEKVFPRFVQRTFDCGLPLVDLTQANKLAGELEDMEFMKLAARLDRQSQKNKPRAA